MDLGYYNSQNIQYHKVHLELIVDCIFWRDAKCN